MEIITGYFISKGQAMEAAEYLRERGFKGRISVIGRQNEEDNRENVRNDTNDTNVISSIFAAGVPDGFSTIPVGSSAFMIQGSGIAISILDQNNHIFGGGLNETLEHWGIPTLVKEEIKGVVGSGNSVILLESKENDKTFIKDSLKYKGAQNIHI